MRRASNNEAEVRRVEALLMPALACSLASCGHAQMLRSLAQVVSLPTPARARARARARAPATRPRARMPRARPRARTRTVTLARPRPQGWKRLARPRPQGWKWCKCLLCERRCCERRM
jgi:hypothetical protein